MCIRVFPCVRTAHAEICVDVLQTDARDGENRGQTGKALPRDVMNARILNTNNEVRRSLSERAIIRRQGNAGARDI